ncbi:unnamed protein product [Acanthosepion pharaonis]|uniref:Uncharacterized protein n=1 Tax=Acanthosepion pharaonis TaxID=158019 RepID=A0A812C6S1_ACAPH|nr:unnamed protein product [Sepia pharaonis]
MMLHCNRLDAIRYEFLGNPCAAFHHFFTTSLYYLIRLLNTSTLEELRNLFKETAGNPLQPTSNGTGVQPYPLSRTSATSSSYRSRFFSLASSIPFSHPIVSSPSNSCCFSLSINTRSGLSPDTTTSTGSVASTNTLHFLEKSDLVFCSCQSHIASGRQSFAGPSRVC